MAWCSNCARNPAQPLSTLCTICDPPLFPILSTGARAPHVQLPSLSLELSTGAPVSRVQRPARAPHVQPSSMSLDLSLGNRPPPAQRVNVDVADGRYSEHNQPSDDLNLELSLGPSVKSFFPKQSRDSRRPQG